MGTLQRLRPTTHDVKRCDILAQCPARYLPGHLPVFLTKHCDHSGCAAVIAPDSTLEISQLTSSACDTALRSGFSEAGVVILFYGSHLIQDTVYVAWALEILQHPLAFLKRQYLRRNTGHKLRRKTNRLPHMQRSPSTALHPPSDGIGEFHSICSPDKFRNIVRLVPRAEIAGKDYT